MPRYRPWAAAYTELARQERAAAGPVTIPASVVQAMIVARCADGVHSQETDEATGNEVCRFCLAVLDDYPDVVMPRHCRGCGRAGGELTEDGCPTCGPAADVR